MKIGVFFLGKSVAKKEVQFFLLQHSRSSTEHGVLIQYALQADVLLQITVGSCITGT